MHETRSVGMCGEPRARAALHVGGVPFGANATDCEMSLKVQFFYILCNPSCFNLPVLSLPLYLCLSPSLTLSLLLLLYLFPPLCLFGSGKELWGACPAASTRPTASSASRSSLSPSLSSSISSHPSLGLSLACSIYPHLSVYLSFSFSIAISHPLLLREGGGIGQKEMGRVVGGVPCGVNATDCELSPKVRSQLHNVWRSKVT